MSTSTAPHAEAGAALASQDAELCAICWSAGKAERVQMPCCGSDASTTWYCRACIKLVCDNARGGVGTCPIGCGPIAIADDGSVIKAPRRRGACQVCRQQSVICVPDYCEACLLGRDLALRFECDRCRLAQRIPHPMWRYQRDGPGSFGNVRWRCDARCEDLTYWRITLEDAARIPAAEAPSAWGSRDAWLAALQEQRQRELASVDATRADEPADAGTVAHQCADSSDDEVEELCAVM